MVPFTTTMLLLLELFLEKKTAMMQYTTSVRLDGDSQLVAPMVNSVTFTTQNTTLLHSYVLQLLMVALRLRSLASSAMILRPIRAMAAAIGLLQGAVTTVCTLFISIVRMSIRRSAAVAVAATLFVV